MPRQQTQQRGPKDNSGKKKQQPRKRPNKALNALAIAEQQFPVKPKIRRNRLGEEYGQHNRKRHAGSDEEDSDGDGPDNKRRRFGGDGSDSENAGSDGEGRRWRIGHVDSDDDSELDSDEALGESDEERFEGFTFRGSAKPKTKAKPKPSESKKKNRPISLSEDVEDEDEDEDEDEEDSDDLGEDAIDLTTAWDMNVAAEEEEARAGSKSKNRDEDFGSEEDEEEEEGDDEDEEDSESDEDSDFDMSDDEDAVDEHGLAKLQSFVNSMGTGSTDKAARKKGGKHEHTAPTEFGLSSTQKLTIADLMPSITDSRLKNSLKHVDTAPANKTTSGIPGKLDAPLAKRQQDRLDRAAAYEKSKETMDRWLETVKSNRRAEHLMFPLIDPDAEQTHRIDTTKPQTDLEHAIQNILVESGLTENKGKSAEEQVQEFEELQARKLPIEEIRARRAELRQRRDLLFREEVRAKRIKKIKSKSYRRVHRKEREKLEQQERQALLDAGVDPDEDDREKFERRRAEARMGLKHKESKFAKSLKQTGRTAWDEEARQGAADMALREEELRRRIEGKRATHGDEDYLGSSSSESEEENPWDEEADSDAEKRKLRQKLSKLEGGEDGELELKGPHAKLLSMKFMQNAEASRKAQNDAEIRKLNRELHGEESQSEAESEVGRRKFGHSDKNKSGQQQKPKALPRNEFEEPLGSDEEEDVAAEQDVEVVTDRKGNNGKPGRSTNKPRGGLSKAPEPVEPPAEEENPWLVQTTRNNRRPAVSDNQQTVDINLDDATPSGQSSRKVSNKKQKPSSASTQKQHLEPQDDSEEESVPVLLKNHDLVKRAFAGDEVVQDFEHEKRDTIREEDDQVIDNTLPGWGSWAGEGVSKKQQKRQKRFLTKVDGVKPEDRKDAKLARVIINEKRVKKNNKYMATQLPHEFESKAQYERSLRLPIGPEWTTKETFQNATKPRVMVKQGIIKPMEKPTV